MGRQRKEETVADRVDHVSRSLWRASNTIRGELKKMESLEQYLKGGSKDIDAQIVTMFRLHLGMIRMECDNLHDGSEPRTEPD